MAKAFEKVPGGCVDVGYIVLGMISNNVYFIEDGCGGVAVVDPSCHADEILETVGDRKVSAIICTHNHWDHVGALRRLRDVTGAPVYASSADAAGIEAGSDGPRLKRVEACPVDVRVDDGDDIAFGNLVGRVISTPGHTPGCICILFKPEHGTNEQGSPVLVSGDTLFQGAHGRTDFEGGSQQQMNESLMRLSKLPGDTIVLPGHGNQTTIADELPLFQQATR